MKQGACHVRSSLTAIIDNQESELTGILRKLLSALYEHLQHIDKQIAIQSTELQQLAKQNDQCKRLVRVPGIGYLTATILLTVTGRPTDFKKGREFTAFSGLVSRQYSTGGKSRLFGITKRGNSAVRTLLIHGARAVLRSMKLGHKPFGNGRMTVWLAEFLERRGYNRTCVALANKLARIAWTMMAKEAEFQLT